MARTTTINKTLVIPTTRRTTQHQQNNQKGKTRKE